MKKFYGKILIMIFTMLTVSSAGELSLGVTAGSDMLIGKQKEIFNPGLGGGLRLQKILGTNTVGFVLDAGGNYFINKSDSTGTFVTFPVNLIINKPINISSFRMSPGLILGGTGTYLADDTYKGVAMDLDVGIAFDMGIAINDKSRIGLNSSIIMILEAIRGGGMHGITSFKLMYSFEL